MDRWSDPIYDQLTCWLAEREGVSPYNIDMAKIKAEEGFQGSEVTPPDGFTCTITYRLDDANKEIVFETSEVAKMLNDIWGTVT